MAPSQKTALAWKCGYTRHVIRMESVLFAVAFVGFIFAIATGALSVRAINDRINEDRSAPYYTYTVNGVTYRRPYIRYNESYLNWEKHVVWARVLVAPIVTVFVSALDLFLYYRSCLHPVYTLCLSIFFMLGWIVVFIFNLFTGYVWSEVRAGGIVCSIIMEICFGILMCGYFSYMIISAVGVDFARKAKRAGLQPGEAKRNVTARADAVPVDDNVDVGAATYASTGTRSDVPAYNTAPQIDSSGLHQDAKDKALSDKV